MKLVFGLELDRSCYAGAETGTSGTHYLGPGGLMELLERLFGLAGPLRENEYLRMEAFRQICRKAVEKYGDKDLFFARSFEADDFATAADLLSRYDELLLLGWDFAEEENMPPRLQAMARLHKLSRGHLPQGKAERLLAIEQRLEGALFDEVRVVEPLSLLPPFWQRLLPRLGPVAPAGLVEDREEPVSDLQKFQHFLRSGERSPATGDGSLFILQTADTADAASYVAALFRENPGFRPLCLVPGFSSRLDFAMVKEGLPSLGLQSVSLARPGLQLLKLAPAFLWEPIDPYKLMEFVSLPVKPLDDELALVIARELAQAPGLRGEHWRRSIAAFFAERKDVVSPEQLAALKKQYNFWFARPRYELQSKAPKEEIVKLFSHLMHWAREYYEKSNEKQQSLLVLHAQARHLTELLEYLPEKALSALELERLVRAVYQPSPVQFRQREAGSPDSVHHPAAVAEIADDVLWWDFTNNDPSGFFARWYREECRWLQQRSLSPEMPDVQNRRLLWQQQLPVLKAARSLLLVLPESDRGEPCLPHSLMSELRVAFGESLCKIKSGMGDPIPGLSNLPLLETLQTQLPEPVKPFLYFRYKNWLEHRREETFSSVEDLLYYPHKWFFRYGLQLRNAPILSIVEEETLMGKLAHRLFEKLMNEDCLSWSREELYSWIDGYLPHLLHAEGAVLMMYGKEPERVRFVRRMKQAAWFLINQLRENAWEVKATELPLHGPLSDDITVKGVADLVLSRAGELCVVDLKWRGLGHRRALIKNEEDLQLVLYARLLSSDNGWAHTAFFILDSVELLARTRHAFRQIRPLASEDTNPAEVNQRIWDKLLRTFQWRREQLLAGRVELRTRATTELLEAMYAEEGIPMMELLEMKSEDARFDDYAVLMGLA